MRRTPDQARRRHLRQRPVLAALALLGSAGLSGCSILSSPEGERFEGERIAVLAFERSLEAAPELAGRQIRLPPPYVNESWPQPGGYADNTMQHLAASGALEQIWSADAGVGSSSDGFLTAPPIVADGRVYVIDTEASVRAFDAAGGGFIWEQALAGEDDDPEEGYGGGIAFSQGRVFATTGFGRLVALDAATGGIIWVQDRGLPFRAAPTVDGGRVFAETYDSDLTASAAATGAALWSHQGITESAGILQATSPAVAGGIVVAPHGSGEIFALRVDNGAVAWSDLLVRTTALTSLAELNDIAGRPVIDRGLVMAVSHSGRMAAIDLRTGSRVWTRDIDSVQTPWIAGDYVYVVTTNAELVCLSRMGGSIHWVTQLPAYEDEDDREDPIEWAGPVLAGDRLLLVSSDARAVSVSPYTGAILGEIEIEDAGFITPVVADQTLYLLTNDGTLTAYR